MNKFTMKKVGLPKVYSDNSKFQQYKILKKEGKITYDDVKEMTKYLQKNAKKKNVEMKIGIRALAIDQWKTLKSMDNELMTEEEYDEYFINKVQDISKFNKFEQLQFYIITN